MEEVNKEIPELKKDWLIFLVISIIILLIVISFSWYFSYKNKAFLWEINSNNVLISDLSNQIQKLKLDNQIMAYDIIKSNKLDIENNIENTKAQKYINEMNSLAKKYKLKFSSFTFNWKSISTIASTQTLWEKLDSISYVSSFIENFRTTWNELFFLDPVTSVIWNDIFNKDRSIVKTERNFWISFKLK